MRNVLLLIVVGCVIVSCTKTGTLYPANDLAGQTGPLHVEYEDDPFALGGPLTIFMPDGEVLHGEYRTVDRSTQTFGTIYHSLRGDSVGRITGNSTQTSVMSPGSMPGFIGAYGEQGTFIECEYIANMSGGGTGVCQTGDGAIYRLIF